MEFIYKLLSEGLSLRATGIIIGLALLGSHIFALRRPEVTQSWLKRFPRHRTTGIILLAISLVFAWSWVKFMDLGEFYVYRKWVLIILPIVFVLVIQFADEFLAVRGLGTCLLLIASPILTASDFQEPATRLLIPLLTYAWITAGLFFVGMPFLLRNGITWLTAAPSRFKAATLAGIGYGALVFICAFTW